MKLTVAKAVLAASAGILIMAASGCATKGYVSKKIQPLDKKVNATAALVNKQQGQISYLNEQMTTANNKLEAVGGVAQQANATATQAMQQSQQNAETLQSQSSQLESQASQLEQHSNELERLGNEFNFSVVETVNVTFPTSKWQLSSADKAVLDRLIQKAMSTPRAVFEVTGFTDDTGPTSYNLTLSRRRADAVARYLASKNVPLKSIAVIGMGKEQTPKMLAAEFEAFNPHASKRQIRALARRVRIRLLAPGAPSATASTASSDSSPVSSSVN
ncbi:MAG TPA: OmpA family protein [Bryobacteraceae bacterium]|nr:OmpA family protein [Bryobacteraceae bacterium]